MKTNDKIINKKSIILFTGFLLLGCLTANAQIPPPPGGGNPNVIDYPIDGFLGIGLITGAYIGLRNRMKGLKD